MIPQQLTQTAELGLAGVFETEIESLMSSALVHDLQPSIVLQNFQDCAVGLPEELEPWRDNCSISSILGLFSGNSGKQDLSRAFR